MDILGLISNQIDGINTTGLSQGFTQNPIDGSVFENILERQMDISKNESYQNSNMIGEMGIPVGLTIEPFNQDLIGIQNSAANNIPIDTSSLQIKEIANSDYFSSVMQDNLSDNNFLFDLTKKQAMSSYNQFGRNLIENLTDFIQDTAKNI